MTDFLHRYLDPSDTLGELLFGLIMALTLTLGAGLLNQGGALPPHDLALALVGCNVAWGVIDSVLYLLGTIFYRNQRRHFVRRLKTARTDQEALASIREEYDLEDEPLASDQDRAAFHRTLLEVLKHAKTHRAHLHRPDVIAALLIVVLVAATALPGVIPLLLIEDQPTAVRVANLVQICLLFCIGFGWARHTGGNPWRTGLVIVLLGVALVSVAVALGG